MYGLLLALHILICFSLIVVVLLQSGKGGGLAGGAFGGTAQTVFGGRGATDFMTRATMVLGGAFFLTSLALALISSGAGRSARSLIQEEARRAPAAVPQVPGTAPGQAPAQRAPSQPAAPQQTPPAGAQPATPTPGGGGK
jgi:preprotein translocase subunit SecG